MCPDRTSARAGLADRTSGLALLAGAGLYAAAVGIGEVTFNATPLMIGLVAIGAGIVGRRALVPIGLTLAGWGTAVLLVADGPLPDNRVAPAYLIGMAVGLFAAHLVGRAWKIPLTGSILTAFNGGLAFYLAYDVDAMGEWPLWAVLVAAWGLIELIRPTQSPHPAS